MNARGARRRDWITAAVVCSAVAVAIASAAIAPAYDTGDAISSGTTGMVLATVAVVGAVVTLTVPRNAVGWLMLAGAVAAAVGQAATEAGVHGVVTSPGSVPAANYLAAVGPGLRGGGWVIAVAAVPAVFPDGRLLSTRWRWLGLCIAAAVTFTVLGGVLSPHAQDDRLTRWQSPLGLPSRFSGVADVTGVAGAVLAAVAAIGAVASLVSRWRRGGPLVRQQLLLLALAVAVLGALAFVVVAIVVLGGSVPGWVFGLALLPLPIAVAVATLHYGLYDLRRAANRTLVWLTLSGSVLALYAAVVIGATLFPIGGWLPGAVAAGVAALLLLPLRDAIQRGVNLLIYGRWREPYEVLSGLGEQLEAAADVDGLLQSAVQELGSGLGLQDVRLSTADGNQSGPGIVSGTSETNVPLLAYGVRVGTLTYQAPAGQLSNAEQRLLSDLARQLGAVLHVQLLAKDLVRARERLVIAREEERRRLRRDLHDGLGPGLAGLTLKAETVAALLPRDAAAASQQLEGLTEEIRGMVVDVRRLVEGLRPPALDELGLAGACQQAVDRLAVGTGLALALRTGEQLPPLPAAVEVAAYRIVVESVTNVVRHAHATCCDVSLALDGAELLVRVTDDGQGLAEERPAGNGMAIMQERAEEVGGQVSVTSGARGVCVAARLPVNPLRHERAPVPATAP